MTTKLVTRDDIALHKQISKTVFDDVLNACILQAQIQDVAPLLGEKLFNKIMKSPSAYAELLNSGEYTVGGENFQNYGLKAVISNFAYARYVMQGSFIDTPFSFVEKMNGNDSKPVSGSDKKTVWQMSKDDALGYWKSVQNYLIRTKNADFQNLNACGRSLSGFGFNISKIV